MRVGKGVIRLTYEMEQKMGVIRDALHITPDATHEMFEEAKRINEELNTILLQLVTDKTYSSRNAPVPQTINSRMNYVIYGMYSSSSPPTQTMKEQYIIVKEEMDVIVSDLRKLIDVDINNMEDKMEEVGAPYTPARIPELK